MRHYSAWVTEADQRAAGAIVPRMPPRPRLADLPPRVEIQRRSTWVDSNQPPLA
jgi:hypothetical protein